MKSRNVSEVYRKDMHSKRSDPYLDDKQHPDKNPAGYLYVTDSEFVRGHEKEIEHLISNEAVQAKSEHPLQRIMTWEKLSPKCSAAGQGTQ